MPTTSATPLSHPTIPVITNNTTRFAWLPATRIATDAIFTSEKQKCDIIVSDGSFKNGKNTYGIVFHNDDQQQTGRGAIKSDPDHTSSFRAEAAGAAAAIFRYHRIPKKYYCDNIALIRQLNNGKPLHPLSPEWELVEPTRKIFVTENVHSAHVKGHQDDDHSNCELSPLAKLNIIAHQQADRGHHHKATSLTPSGFKVLLLIQDTPITTKYDRQIRHAYTTSEIATYFRKQYLWSTTVAETIDWHSLSTAIASISKYKQAVIIKLLHGWSFRTVTSDFATPLCKCVRKEAVAHLLRCPLNAEHVSLFISRLNKKLSDLRTHRPLREFIIALFREITPTPWRNYGTHLARAIEEKQKLGIEAIFSSILTQTWGDIQEEAYRERGERRELTGNRWVKAVILEIFSTLQVLWKTRNERLHGKNEQDLERENLKSKLKNSKKKICTYHPAYVECSEKLLMTSQLQIAPYSTYVAGFASLPSVLQCNDTTPKINLHIQLTFVAISQPIKYLLHIIQIQISSPNGNHDISLHREKKALVLMIQPCLLLHILLVVINLSYYS